MRRVIWAVMVAIVGAVWGGVLLFDAAGAPPACAPPHQLRIVDLGMIPDPVRRGQPIRLWAVTIRSDYNGECLTVLEVRDRDQVAGRKVEYRITPGIGRYTFQAERGYAFQPRDHCFTVVASIGNNWTPIDAVRGFCAKYQALPPPGGWSLK